MDETVAKKIQEIKLCQNLIMKVSTSQRILCPICLAQNPQFVLTDEEQVSQEGTLNIRIVSSRFIGACHGRSKIQYYVCDTGRSKSGVWRLLNWSILCLIWTESAYRYLSRFQYLTVARWKHPRFERDEPPLLRCTRARKRNGCITNKHCDCYSTHSLPYISAEHVSSLCLRVFTAFQTPFSSTVFRFKYIRPHKCRRSCRNKKYIYFCYSLQP